MQRTRTSELAESLTGWLRNSIISIAMKKSEIFDILVNKVCEVCEVRMDTLINGSRLQSVVDARVLSVQYLRRIGLTNDDIALIVMRKIKGDMTWCPPIPEVKAKAKGVQRMFDSYSQRCLDSYAFCIMSSEIKDFCREQYKDMYLSWMKQLPTK